MESTPTIEIGVREFEKAIDQIGTAIIAQNDKPYYDAILGVARGGLVPAVALSHYIGAPLYPIRWSNRDDNVCSIGQEAIIKMMHSKKVLIVEDIIDSGRTFVDLIKYLRTLDTGCQFDSASIITNVAQTFTPTYTWMLIDRDEDKRWVDFFWERKVRQED
jgi:hypoxanthine phosphoribosyltransferase